MGPRRRRRRRAAAATIGSDANALYPLWIKNAPATLSAQLPTVLSSQIPTNSDGDVFRNRLGGEVCAGWRGHAILAACHRRGTAKCFNECEKQLDHPSIPVGVPRSTWHQNAKLIQQGVALRVESGVDEFASIAAALALEFIGSRSHLPDLFFPTPASWTPWMSMDVKVVGEKTQFCYPRHHLGSSKKHMFRKSHADAAHCCKAMMQCLVAVFCCMASRQRLVAARCQAIGVVLL